MLYIGATQTKDSRSDDKGLKLNVYTNDLDAGGVVVAEAGYRAGSRRGVSKSLVNVIVSVGGTFVRALNLTWKAEELVIVYNSRITHQACLPAKRPICECIAQCHDAQGPVSSRCLIYRRIVYTNTT